MPGPGSAWQEHAAEGGLGGCLYDGRMTRRRRWPFVVATIPLWPIAALLLSATYAGLTLGRWPTYNQPDPSDVSPLILDVAVFPLLLLAPVACIAALILAVRDWSVGRSDWLRIALTALGSLLVLAGWMWGDPGGFFEWWID